MLESHLDGNPDVKVPGWDWMDFHGRCWASHSIPPGLHVQSHKMCYSRSFTASGNSKARLDNGLVNAVFTFTSWTSQRESMARLISRQEDFSGSENIEVRFESGSCQQLKSMDIVNHEFIFINNNKKIITYCITFFLKKDIL